jgi:hypothetical protein
MIDYSPGQQAGIASSNNTASLQIYAMLRAIGAASLMAFLIFGQPAAAPQTRASASDMRPDVPLPAESAGWDNVVGALLSAFDHVDVVALADSHWRKVDSDLRLRLIRHPDFPNKVRYIVVEFGNSLYQPILDRYIQGEDVPKADVQQVWRNATNGVGGNDSPVYAEFYAAVRDVNRKLPDTKRLRVIAGDPPIDWSKVQTRPDFHEFGDGDRRDFPVSLHEVAVKRGEKALVIYGSTHIVRPRFPLWAAGRESVASTALRTFKAVQVSNPQRVFVVDTIAGPDPAYEKLEKALQSRERPVLASLIGTRAAALVLETSYVFMGKKVTNTSMLGAAIDACVYFGNSADVDKRLDPDPAIYQGTPYGAEIARRRKIMEARH